MWCTTILRRCSPTCGAIGRWRRCGNPFRISTKRHPRGLPYGQLHTERVLVMTMMLTTHERLHEILGALHQIERIVAMADERTPLTTAEHLLVDSGIRDLRTHLES